MRNYCARRIKDLQNLLKKEKKDALILTRPVEVGFFGGFHLEGCALLVTRKEAIAFTSKMLFEQVSSMMPFAEVTACDSVRNAAAEFTRERKLKKAVFEPENVSYPEGIFWKKNGFLEKSGLTAKLRAVKKGAELAAVRKSCRVAASVFSAVKKKIKKGRTEISVARELEDLMQAKGAYGPSFRIIAAFGENSALPHHESSSRRLKNNEAVLIDYGCVRDFYCSDMTRTFFYGKAPAKFKEVYSIVDKAQKSAIKAVKSGVKASIIDKICRDYISDKGYGQYFMHGTGHGIGLEVHEAPTLNTKSKETLKTGMTVTVEPGIYLKGEFGVRIEDSVLVTKRGREILTR